MEHRRKFLTKVDCSNMAREIVPEEQFKAENWGELGHKELLEIEKGCDQLKQIENMIKMARQTWTLQFSRFYQMIAVSRDSQYLIKNNSNVVIMAVNWAGIFIVSNESEQILQVYTKNVLFKRLIRHFRHYASWRLKVLNWFKQCVAIRLGLQLIRS